MATLVYSDVDGIDRSFALGQDPITVGRAAECAIRSDDPRVSRLHARFFLDAGKLWVEVRRVEINRLKESRVVGDAKAGLDAVTKLAESDMMIAALQNELGTAKKAAAAANADVRLADMNAQLTALAARADKAEKELQS